MNEKTKKINCNGVPATSKRKRKLSFNGCKNITQLEQDDSVTAFALLLASLSNSNLRNPSSISLMKKCLARIHPSLLSQYSFRPILALLPALLTSRNAGIVRRSLAVVGAASIVSYEMNEEIASDGEIVKALILLMISSYKRVVCYACNAVLDLCSTSVGQQSLLHCSALEKLMFAFLQIPVLPKSVTLRCMDNASVDNLEVVTREDELAMSYFNAIIILTNASSLEQLQQVPMNLYEMFLISLKELWTNVRDQMLHGNDIQANDISYVHRSNITLNTLAETIFRLSVGASHRVKKVPVELVQRSIFNTSGSNLEHFMLNHWERSPFLLRRVSGDLDLENNIFGPFIQSLSWTGAVPDLISSILHGLVSCLPLSLDEIDIINFLSDARDKLGCPIIYQQDIRVVKTDCQTKREIHYFQNYLNSSCTSEPHCFTIDDILGCGEAYEKGYTIALRGMEFRSPCIAAIADGLASLFCQPSIGFNLYLTPPNSQGLACHADDHCVFVCQIYGSKRWRVFERHNLLLPRLYDPSHSLQGAKINISDTECKEFFLREGDIMYIPRGFPHEAHTYCNVDGDAEISLHLTLSVEIEPPFEWEGFAHSALHLWYKKKLRPCHGLSLPLSELVDVLTVKLLHVAIVTIGDSDPIFRKACLATAIFPSEQCNGIAEYQKTTFNYVISEISIKSSLSEVFKSIDRAVQKNEDPLQKLRWLWLLHKEQEIDEKETSMEIVKLSSLYAEHRDQVEAAFLDVKSRFCNEIVYEDVIASFKLMLEKYKKIRRQYMDGMVALHHKM